MYLVAYLFVCRAMIPLETLPPPGDTSGGSSLPPDCFVSRGIISPGAASQETPRISRNPKVHYRTHQRPPPVSILGQPNPVHKGSCPIKAPNIPRT